MAVNNIKNPKAKVKDIIKKKKKTEEKPRIKLKSSGTQKQLKVRGGKGMGL